MEQIQHWLGAIPIPLWVFLLIVLFVAVRFSTGKAKTLFGALLGIIFAFIVAFGLSYFWIWSAATADRFINHGDFSEPVDYVKTVSNGTVWMKRGVQEKFYVVGEVKLVNNNDYTCLRISPDGRFHIRSQDDFRINYIEAKSGEKEMALVEVMRQADCP